MKKKKSLREKGNSYQRWIRDWLQDRGWIVRNFPMTSRPILIPETDPKKFGQKKMIWLPQNNDVFGCDLIARNRKGPLILWIQCSLDDHITRRAEEFLKYFKYVSPWERVMIWIKREKWHSIKLVTLGRTGLMVVEDLGKIQVGKFTLARGVPDFTFGEKKGEKNGERKE